MKKKLLATTTLIGMLALIAMSPFAGAKETRGESMTTLQDAPPTEIPRKDTNQIRTAKLRIASDKYCKSELGFVHEDTWSQGENRSINGFTVRTMDISKDRVTLSVFGDDQTVKEGSTASFTNDCATYRVKVKSINTAQPTY